MAGVLDCWKSAKRLPGGRWLFSRRFAARAPYFRTIAPQFTRVERNLVELVLAKRRRILNHVGTVHAIAICNGAEAAMGALAEATVPPDKRWIPKAMSVAYLAPAKTHLTCRASTTQDQWDGLPADRGAELAVLVEANDTFGTTVMRGTIQIWVSPKKK